LTPRPRGRPGKGHMDIVQLDRIFHPRSVAVIGASEQPGKSGTAVMRNLIASGYEGAIHPVNPGFTTLWQRPCLRSVTDIDRPADLAVITTRITTVPRIIRQCVRAGVGAAVIISSGGKEIGPRGVEMEQEIRKAAAGSPLRIIGPNSLGVVCSRCKLNVTTAHRMPPPGRLAFISQSGALATAIFDSAGKERIGFSHFVGLGSMMDVNFGDLIDYLGNDGRVRSIVMYVEHLTDARRFMSAARAVSNIKPIIALKAGRTSAGALAAARHTGAATGEDAVYDAAFKRAGILRVRTFEALFDCAELVAKQPRPQRTGLAICSNAGGPAVMAVDALGVHGVAPVALSAETQARLEHILSPVWSRANPVDIGREASARRYLEAVQVLLKAPEIDGLLLMFAPQAMADPTTTAQLLTPHLENRRIPVVTAWLGGSAVETARAIFNQAGIPTFDSPERAVGAFMDLYHYGRNIEMLRQIPAKLPRRLSFDKATAAMLVRRHMGKNGDWMREGPAKRLLTAYGIPVTAARRTRTGPRGIELYLGMHRDGIFGPVIKFGWGGTLTDIVDDYSLGLPPLNRLLAKRMIEETKVYRLLCGYPNHLPANVVLLEEVLIRLSQLTTDFAQIEQIALNPLIATGQRVWAAHARVRLHPSPVPAPMHLAIAPYPNEYETTLHLPDTGEIFIRPIRPEDAPLMQALFGTLSEQSIYFRFFRPLKALPEYMLARFTQIDYDREIAIVAIKENAGKVEEMMAVGRIIKDPDPRQAEFAILVGDPWHGKGIGAALLHLCLRIAKSQGVQKIWGKVMADNTHMLVLGRKMNFSIARDPDSGEYELRLDLSQLPDSMDG
jgi:acetyltransferase